VPPTVLCMPLARGARVAASAGWLLATPPPLGDGRVVEAGMGAPGAGPPWGRRPVERSGGPTGDLARHLGCRLARGMVPRVLLGAVWSPSAGHMGEGLPAAGAAARPPPPSLPALPGSAVGELGTLIDDIGRPSDQPAPPFIPSS
jgi:hypothetical protein